MSATRLALTFDPGNSTGWCVLNVDAPDREAVADSGQCDFADSMPAAFEALMLFGARTAPVAVAIEKPVIVPSRGGFGNAGSALETAWKAGCLYGRAITLWPGPKMWEPRPAEWRAVLGLGKGGRSRAEIMVRVCAWVKATTGVDCGTGESEARSRVDEAMAIALAFAARDALHLGGKGGMRAIFEKAGM